MTSKIKSIWSPVKQNPPVEKEAKILLIGSTGNGKSTLGNFLLNPARRKPGDRAFETSTTSLPETQKCKAVNESSTIIERSHYSEDHTNDKNTEIDEPPSEPQEIKCIEQSIKLELSVIDTPGLNESMERDINHMVNLIETIEREETINACIIVVKSSLKIDQQFKDTIKYYSKLLPQFFSKNVLIVMTAYATDSRSKAIREEQGIDDDENMKIVVREIVSIADLTYKPMLFTIDCLPYGKTEMAESESKRQEILSYILSKPAVLLKDLRVAKTMLLLEADQQEIKSLEGEVKGYSLRLKEVNKSATKALDSTCELQNPITEANGEISKKQSEIKEKESDDLIAIETWKIDDNKFWPWWRKREIDIETEFNIMKVFTWTNGSCNFVNLEQTPRRYRAKLRGNFTRHLLAELTLNTQKKFYYANDIKKLKADITFKEKIIQKLKEEAEMNSKSYKEYKAEIERLETFIEERREKIKKLSVMSMSVEETKLRMKDISDSKIRA